MSEDTNKSGGVGFFGLLTIAFIALKLSGHITWPWLWVLSPLLIPVAIPLVIFAISFILYLVLGVNK